MIDSLMQKRYDAEKYNCVHFAIDAWMLITGEDISYKAGGLLNKKRTFSRDNISCFNISSEPSDPSIVLMQRHRDDPHVGVYTRGRIAHLRQGGAEYTDPVIACAGFTNIRYLT